MLFVHQVVLCLLSRIWELVVSSWTSVIFIVTTRISWRRLWTLLGWGKIVTVLPFAKVDISNPFRRCQDHPDKNCQEQDNAGLFHFYPQPCSVELRYAFAWIVCLPQV